jgi:hypothetical protein
MSSAPDMNTYSPERFERRKGDGNWTHNMTAVRKLKAYIFVDARSTMDVKRRNHLK